MSLSATDGACLGLGPRLGLRLGLGLGLRLGTARVRARLEGASRQRGELERAGATADDGGADEA